MEMTFNNLCNSCTNIGCEFQSGIVRTKCAFYMPPHIEPDNCGNYVVMQPTVRLIDADALREEVSSWGMNDYEPSDFTDAIDDAPTVEAIPKADYKNRLKADMVAMLTEIQLECEEVDFFEGEEPINITQELMDEVKSWGCGVKDCCKIIQQKINALKENSCGNNKRED